MVTRNKFDFVELVSYSWGTKIYAGILFRIVKVRIIRKMFTKTVLISLKHLNSN